MQQSSRKHEMHSQKPAKEVQKQKQSPKQQQKEHDKQQQKLVTEMGIEVKGILPSRATSLKRSREEEDEETASS